MKKTKITGDEPANPTIESLNHNGIIEIKTSHQGLTIRQEFAKAAMQGMLANPDGCMTEGSSRSFNPSTLAACAVNQADYLIQELNKPH